MKILLIALLLMISLNTIAMDACYTGSWKDAGDRQKHGADLQFHKDGILAGFWYGTHPVMMNGSYFIVLGKHFELKNTTDHAAIFDIIRVEQISSLKEYPIVRAIEEKAGYGRLYGDPNDSDMLTMWWHLDLSLLGDPCKDTCEGTRPLRRITPPLIPCEHE